MSSALILDNSHLSRVIGDSAPGASSIAIDCNSHPLLESTIATNCTETISQSVLTYLENGISKNTRRAYAADLRHYESWGGALPASAASVANYLAAHADKLACATLERRLATLSKVHTMHGYPNPVASELVKATLRGIRRKHGVAQRQVAPLSPSDLQNILRSLTASARDVRDQALLLVGFAGAFRRSELVALELADIDWRIDRIVVSIRRSKTDQVRRGRKITIPVLGNVLCPAAALQKWIDLASIVQGPIFRAVNRRGRISISPLSAEAVAKVIKKRAAQIGLDPARYSGHSLRAGFVSTAAAAGASLAQMKLQTGHSSDRTLWRYARPDETSAAPSPLRTLLEDPIEERKTNVESKP